MSKVHGRVHTRIALALLDGLRKHEFNNHNRHVVKVRVSMSVSNSTPSKQHLRIHVYAGQIIIHDNRLFNIDTGPFSLLPGARGHTFEISNISRAP